MAMLIVGGMGTISKPLVGVASLPTLRHAWKRREERLNLYGFSEII
ncbi:MAG TPA: hypothetical protein VLH40_05765 [Atribacteraceae bacterium]|nr:hypothetical protein [Atribacteraceae bacterium]